MQRLLKSVPALLVAASCVLCTAVSPADARGGWGGYHGGWHGGGWGRGYGGYYRGGGFGSGFLTGSLLGAGLGLLGGSYAYPYPAYSGYASPYDYDYAYPTYPAYTYPRRMPVYVYPY